MEVQRKQFLRSLPKKLWFLACILVLEIVLIAHDGTPNSDAGILLIYGMGALTFPIGVAYLMLVGGLYSALYSFVGITVSTSRVEMTVVWVGFVLVGHLQWWVVLPTIVSRLRKTGGRSKTD